ncbi:hypothetical protein H072_5341 [Dactylellina haptotyla CBS 200.50]|uniref:Nucleoporin NUP188 n=1 Tax=Dactylellina haptotyla (strain CBS 200.50) TaxID=1284197 RepID=S8ACW6_DACHA|nr:hypothetical protein H072_5341 [Dactylellina haptotyla CBS 200.50]
MATSNGVSPATRHLPSKTFDSAIEDALKNNTPLLSWRSALYRLTTPSRSSVAIRNLKNWLLSSPQLASLTSSYAVVPPPNATSKQTFETKTAMINITADTVLPVAEIKKDAMELSAALALDELEALRICVLEAQQRCPSLSTNSDSSTDAPPTLLTMSMFASSTTRSHPGPGKDSAREIARKARQVQLYCSERRYKIKVATALARIVVEHDSRAPHDNPFYLTARKLLKKMVAEGKKGGKGGFVESLIKDIGQAMTASIIPKYYVDGRTQFELLKGREEWERQTLINIYHCLQFLFLLIYRPISPSGKIVSSWYQCMGSTAFLTDHKFLSKPFNSAHQSIINSIIPLGAIISVEMLAVESLEVLINGSVPGNLSEEIDPGASYYLEDAEAASLVHDVLLEYVGEKGFLPASLAAWAWAIILTTYDNNSEDEIAGGDQSNLILNRVNKTLGGIMTSSTQAEGPALFIAKKALKSNLLHTIANFVHGVPGGSGWSIQSEEDSAKMLRILAGLMRVGMDLLDWEVNAIHAFIATHTEPRSSALSYEEQQFFINDLEEEEEEKDTEVAASSFELVKFTEGSLARNVWSDKIAVEKTIHMARVRFPYESLSFCALLNATTPRKIIGEPYNLSLKYLEDHMESFTYVLPINFRGTEVDENDASKIVLFQDLQVVEGRREDGGGAFTLPAGIFGKIISTSVSPPVVRWDYKYSGVEFLGRLLEKVLLEESFLDSGLAIEILGIFDSILVSYRDVSADAAAKLDETYSATRLLEDASNILAPNSDIISVVLDLFEASLPFSITAKSVELASACLRVITTLVEIVPGRIWPLLGRSSLLERNGRGGLLSKILESVEIVQGDYTFLLTAFSMYETLLSDAIAGVVFSGTIGSPGSIVSGSGVGSGISREMQTSILQDWTRFWCSIFESFTTWKYLHVKQRLTLNFRICKTFSRILNTVYGVASDENDGYGLFDGLASSASIICDFFLSKSQTPTIDPLLLSIKEGLETIESTVHNLFVADWITSVTTSLRFGATALKVQHQQKRTPSHLEKALYERSLDLISLYEVDEHFRQPVIDILDSLVSGSDLWVGEPPSLLGYIRPSGANHLVELLQRLGGRLGDEELEAAIWGFFCTVISNKQQGLSIKLVTGSNLEIPTSRANLSQGSQKPAKSMLALALEILVNINNLPAPLLLSTLRAVSIAQDFWGPIIANLPEYPAFLKAVTDYIENLSINYSARTSQLITESCNKTAAAAHISQILTMHLYQLRTTKSSNFDPKTRHFFESLFSKLKFYLENGVKISGYKPSMHGLLAFNFRNKWPCCHLENFRKSSMQERRYGVNYFYDIELAEEILNWDRGWNCVTTRRTSDKVIGTRAGFRVDVESVNLNLALIDSQVFLLDMWSNLALELACHKPFHTIDVVTELANTVIDALKAGISEATPPSISVVLQTKRTGLAFSLFRRLETIDLPAVQTGKIFTTVLDAVWQVVAAVESDFLHSLSKGGSENSCNLLRLLYVTLKATQRTNPEPSPKLVYLLVGLFDLAVGRAFKSLANGAYESNTTANAGDMLIVIGIMQTILKFNGLEPVHEHLVTHLTNHGTIRVATILFTWASKLAEVPTGSDGNPDPLYGEISIMFLVKLSALPILAEQIALNSVFNSLSEGDLATKIQAGQLLPTTTPRLHNIWSKGFLPLLLNVLFALKKRVAPEIAMFLRSFNRQIIFTMSYLSKPEYVTLSHLEEITDLSAILILLDRMGSSPGDEIMERVRSLDNACDQIISHKAWLSKVLVATNAEEDVLLQNEIEGNNKLGIKVAAQAKMIQKLVVSVDGGDEQMN